MNSSHFISIGFIPSSYNVPTYYELRNRKNEFGNNWINNGFKNIISQKPYDNNQYDNLKKYFLIHTYFYCHSI